MQASELLSALNLDKLAITDHLPDIIGEITRDLVLRREGDISIEHTRGSPPVHGVQRFHDGLDVGEVVTEYNLLREAFTTVANRNGLQVEGDAVRIINHRLDESVRLAVTAFAAQQALIRKQQDEDHLAFIAHDLRTPLSAVALLVDELSQCLDRKVLAENADAFTVLRRNLQRLEELIKRVLAAKVATDGNGSSFHPERREFELWPLVQRLIVDLGAISSKSGTKIVNQMPRSLTVFADAGLISQVFQNLLGNAFKYAACGEVTISAHEEDGTVHCVVHDSRAGIPLDMLAKVFEKFTTDPAKSGTGLGLASVKTNCRSARRRRERGERTWLRSKVHVYAPRRDRSLLKQDSKLHGTFPCPWLSLSFER